MHYIFNAERMPEVIASNLEAFSWSFSHFFLWRAFRILFDCGEGAAIRLDDHVFRAEVLAFSHAHSDHCRGLLGFLEARAGLKGDNEKPLRVLYPGGLGSMPQWIDAAKEFCQQRGVDAVTFQAIEEGCPVPLRNGRVLTATTVSHEPEEHCLAYRIGRTRRCLKQEFRGRQSAEIAKLAEKCSRDELEEEKFECELVYSGDTDHLDREFCQGAHVLIHEASFLFADDADSEKGIHSNVGEALTCAAESEARALVLFHSSRRYSDHMFTMGVQSLIERTGLNCPVALIRGSYNLPTD